MGHRDELCLKGLEGGPPMGIIPSSDELARIFGPSSSGRSPDEYARTSQREYVRSQDHLALATPGASGRRLSAWEAYKAFGLQKLEEVLEYGSAVLVTDIREPSATISRRRQDLALEPADLSSFLKMRALEILAAERRDRRTPIRSLEKIARALGLDETRIGIPTAGDVGHLLAVRLREMRDTRAGIRPNVVLKLGESAWVIQKQVVLSHWLNRHVNLRSLGIDGDSRYGGPGYPAWEVGYELAASTRRALGIASDCPIERLRRVVEGPLGLPLTHIELPVTIAGATISTGDARGIAINVNGTNSNVWVRRFTIAHELGHLLWDPDQHLKALIVDSYSDLEREPYRMRTDYVEARANAFAIELLAPKKAALDHFLSYSDPREGLRAVMERFGVSFTAAKYQIWNALDRNSPLESFTVDDIEPTPEWVGRESFTNDYFHPKSVPLSRRGLFAGYVVKCWSEKLISFDSAASYLSCEPAELEANADEITRLFFD